MVRSLALIVCGIGFAGEEGGPPFPYRLLQIHREGVRPGKEEAHRSIEADAARMCARLNCPKAYLTMATVTGAAEVWSLTGYESYRVMEEAAPAYAAPMLAAELERVRGSKAGLVRRPRVIFARYREPLSFVSSANLANWRFFSVSELRIEAGRIQEFESAAQANRITHQNSGVKDSHFVYQVVSGGEEGTYLVFTPFISLREAEAFGQLHDRGFDYVPLRAGMRAVTSLFAVRPAMSYPAKEWIAADPDFWSPKPASGSR